MSLFDVLLKLLLRDDKFELDLLMLDPVSLLLTLLEPESLEPETLRPLLLSVVTLDPLVMLEPLNEEPLKEDLLNEELLKSLEEALDKLLRLELKLDVRLVVPDVLEPETLLLGLKGGEFP